MDSRESKVLSRKSFGHNLKNQLMQMGDDYVPVEFDALRFQLKTSNGLEVKLEPYYDTILRTDGRRISEELFKDICQALGYSRALPLDPKTGGYNIVNTPQGPKFIRQTR